MIEGLYPITTQDGRPIPMEIVKPSSLIYWELVSGVEKVVTIPAGFAVCFVVTTANCFIRNADVTFGAVAEDTEYADAILLPADNVVTLNLTPGAGRRIYPLSDGVIYLSAVKQWAAMVQDMQSRVG